MNMILSQLIEILKENRSLKLEIKLPSNMYVQDRFHITEVGKVTRSFVDYTGTLTDSTSCVIKIFVGKDDFEHRVSIQEFVDVLELGQVSYNLDEYPIDIEYETAFQYDNSASVYPLECIQIDPKNVEIVLGKKQPNINPTEKPIIDVEELRI